MNEHKPCTWCESVPDASLSIEHTWRLEKSDDGKRIEDHRIVCDCGVSGPWRITESQAWAAWDARATPPDATAAEAE